MAQLLGHQGSRAAEAVPPPNDDEQSGSAIDHYLYFPTHARAMEVTRTLKSEGYAVEIRDSRDLDMGWLTLARHTIPLTDQELEAELMHMENLAAANGGTYDGHEREVLYRAK